MQVYTRSLIGTSAATAIALALAAPAHAQSQDAPVPEATPATTTDQSAQPAPAQEPPVTTEEDPYGDEGEAIVVTGIRRGSVVGDIPPENVLGTRDVRATGANDISELLDALAPQLGSARGRGGERPITLLNGQRISSFRELRDIPTEAIERVEILPEEVALKYGYSADQRAVNIVLRERFRSTVARLDGTTATEGGYLGGQGELTRLQIEKNGRTTFNVLAQGNTPLTEDERDIDLQDVSPPDDRSARTLVGSKKLLRGSATVNRTIFGDVGATFNAEVEHNEGRSLFGLSEFALDPLVRNSSSDSLHLGMALNGTEGKWRWSATGNGDFTNSMTRSDRDNETGRDRSESTTTSGDFDITANGPLFAVPAGDASVTVRLGASMLHLDSERIREDLTENSLGRTQGSR